jgi:hypothetical protein
MSSQDEGGKVSESNEGHAQETKKRKWRRSTDEDGKRWAKMYLEKRMPIEAIASFDEVDPDTVSKRLHRLNVDVYAGKHRIDREPAKLSVELAQLLNRGPDEVLRFLDQRVWGVRASPAGMKQLTKFCQFLNVPLKVGVEAVAEELRIDRSMVKAWTVGTKQPYLVRVANVALQASLKSDWKLLPLRLEAGGNEQGPWIQVPTSIQGQEDILAMLQQTLPLEQTYQRAAKFGISRARVEAMRSDMFGYILGIALGDAGKEGGEQERFTSSNLDLQFTKKKESNEMLGEFACMCTNSLGIAMNRTKDKPATGDTLKAKDPSSAYRWISERSPLMAWMIMNGLGLKSKEKTSTHEVHMDWIFKTSFEFRKRFLQALADSDGSVKPYVVILTSVPNAEFVTKLLHSVGIKSAHVIHEDGSDLRTSMNTREASQLPIFNEFSNGYRYRQLMERKND